MIHTCPRCELRFTSDVELVDHLEHDHGVDPEQFERPRYRPTPRPEGRRYVVVANQTFSDEALLDHVRALAEKGAHFHVVVPATPRPGTTDRLDDRGVGLASYRLRHLVDTLVAAGITAEGEVGGADPVAAVARALDHERADEIIVSTLPTESSRWLETDLPHLLEHSFHLPVTVVTRPD